MSEVLNNDEVKLNSSLDEITNFHSSTPLRTTKDNIKILDENFVNKKDIECNILNVSQVLIKNSMNMEEDLNTSKDSSVSISFNNLKNTESKIICDLGNDNTILSKTGSINSSLENDVRINNKNNQNDININQNENYDIIESKEKAIDFDLLEKLEKANRDLEADRKSLRCLSPVPMKKLSTISIISQSSEDINESRFEQDISSHDKEQVEIQRLKTENKLFRQRIEELETETKALAGRLLSNQIKFADQSEEVHNLQDIILEQHHVLEEVDVDVLRHRVRELSSANQNNQMIIEDLRTKTSQLEQMNESLSHEPSMDVQQLEEQLAYCKLREAEAHMTSKDLERKVSELDRYWQKHMALTNEATKEGKLQKSKLERLSEELLSSNLREANLLNQLNEYKQKIAEFESKNNVNERHIKNLETSISEFQERISSLEMDTEKNELERETLTRQITMLQSKIEEEELMVRFKDAENSHLIAELKQKIAHLEIKNEELLTAEKLSDGNGFKKLDNGVEDLDVQISKLQIEMIRLKRLKRSKNDQTTCSFTSDSEDEYNHKDNDNENYNKNILTLSSIMNSDLLSETNLLNGDITTLTKDEVLKDKNLILKDACTINNNTNLTNQDSLSSDTMNNLSEPFNGHLNKDDKLQDGLIKMSENLHNGLKSHKLLEESNKLNYNKLFLENELRQMKTNELSDSSNHFLLNNIDHIHNNNAKMMAHLDKIDYISLNQMHTGSRDDDNDSLLTNDTTHSSPDRTPSSTSFFSVDSFGKNSVEINEL